MRNLAAKCPEMRILEEDFSWGEEVVPIYVVNEVR
jgi:hypothetical protein